MGFTFALVVAFVFGMIAELTGLHIILGAYMAGLFVREGIVNKELFQKINDRFVSITYGFLGPIFFISLSFHMTLDIFKTHLSLIIIMLLVATFGKLLGAGLGARMSTWHTPRSTRPRSSSRLCPACWGLLVCQRVAAERSQAKGADGRLSPATARQAVVESGLGRGSGWRRG